MWIAGRRVTAYCHPMSTEHGTGERLRSIDVGLFRRLAGEDLNLWRDLVGRRVAHRHPRYGIGTIVDARWGTFSEHVPEYIQIRVEYGGGLAATFRASVLDETHRSIEVPAEAADLAERCFGSDAIHDARDCERAVAAYSDAARTRFERARAARIAAKRGAGSA